MYIITCADRASVPLIIYCSEDLEYRFVICTSIIYWLNRFLPAITPSDRRLPGWRRNTWNFRNLCDHSWRKYCEGIVQSYNKWWRGCQGRNWFFRSWLLKWTLFRVQREVEVRNGLCYWMKWAAEGGARRAAIMGGYYTHTHSWETILFIPQYSLENSCFVRSQRTWAAEIHICTYRVKHTWPSYFSCSNRGTTGSCYSSRFRMYWCQKKTRVML